MAVGANSVHSDQERGAFARRQLCGYGSGKSGKVRASMLVTQAAPRLITKANGGVGWKAANACGPDSRPSGARRNGYYGLL
jgi:hypothetical protein